MLTHKKLLQGPPAARWSAGSAKRAEDQKLVYIGREQQRAGEEKWDEDMYTSFVFAS